jgi:hypothetical protein
VLTDDAVDFVVDHMLDAVRKREAKDQRETKIRELEAEVNKLVAAIAKVEEPDGADSEAPFLAPAKVASTNASSRFSFPRWCRCRAGRFSASSSFPLRTHCWKRRWQVWYGGYFSGISRHCAPVPRIQRTPFSTARVSCHGRLRLSARRDGRSTGSTTAHCSSFSSQRPVAALRGHPGAAPGSHKFALQVFMRLVLAAAAAGISLSDTCVKAIEEYRKRKVHIDIERLIEEVRVTALQRIDEADLALVQLERTLVEQGVNIDRTLLDVIKETKFWHPFEAHRLKRIRRSFNALRAELAGQKRH